MVPATAVSLHTGLLLPVSVLHSSLFAVLAAFVAINTVMYGALAVAKVLPKVYPGDWITWRNRRAQSRSIYPQGRVSVDEPLPHPNLEHVG